MAEVRKNENKMKYDTSKLKNDTKKKKTKQETKKTSPKKESNKVEKQNLFVRFRIFCHGVKSEFNKVVWPSKQAMIKYSIAVIVFIIVCAAYFYLIDMIFAFVQSLFK